MKTMFRWVAGVIAVATAVLTLDGGQRSLLLDPESSEFQRQAPAECRIMFDTSRGRMMLEMRRAWAPHGADRFYNLVRAGFYDGARFFRVRPKTWIQFGIPGDPAVAQAWRTRTIPDDPRVESNGRGTVAFAFKEPHGRTTQVFINLRNNATTHDGEPFVPFAKVIEGMDVADSLYAGYGEGLGGIRAGKQDPAFEDGNDFFQKHYPRLDYIIRARVDEAQR